MPAAPLTVSHPENRATPWTMRVCRPAAASQTEMRPSAPHRGAARCAAFRGALRGPDPPLRRPDSSGLRSPRGRPHRLRCDPSASCPRQQPVTRAAGGAAPKVCRAKDKRLVGLGIGLPGKRRKRRPKPELTTAWWKSAWPGDGDPPMNKRMLTALKRHADAQKGDSASDQKTALDNLAALSKDLPGKAKTALKDRADDLKAFTSDLAAFDRLVAAATDRATKIAGGGKSVYKRDFASAVRDDLKSSAAGWQIKTKPIDVESILPEGVVNELDAQSAANDLYKEHDRAFNSAVKSCAKDVAAILADRWGRNERRTSKLVDAKVDEHVTQLQAALRAVPDKVLDRIKLDAGLDREYRKAINKGRLKIAKSAAFTVASGAAIALPGTQAFAIYGFARTAAGLARNWSNTT